MKIGRHVPNLITIFSLLSGCGAIVAALDSGIGTAMWLVVVAACFDFLDGLAARALNAVSIIGKELDSLADVVAFGVAPAMMIVGLLPDSYWRYGAFMIAAMSALRLARFNVDDRQREVFLGLPVPAHALFWASVCNLLWLYPEWRADWFEPAIVGAACLTSLLMVSEVRMFSMKVKSWRWRGNERRYILAGFGVAAVVVAGVGGIAATIFAYVVLSIFNKRGKIR
jgi:CDP-diacylglycerol--serine O-phosphatidyltransferase